ncbi:MAG TPA: class I SAM-dependent methyltransferase [Bryobacteraceae bacterium]|jgi:SAM-dependent methyltransferase|nr:class I SAM-dependent methyltransferase [Bryobacteraceae bacterium]
MPASIELDRPARQESYLQYGSSFVDRLRTRLVQREILKRLPRAGSLRVLDLGCGYHATCLKAILKATGDRLIEGVGVDFNVSEESRRHPRLNFVISSVEEALPELPENAFEAVLFVSVLEHLWDPIQSLGKCFRVLKPGGRLLVNVPTWYAKPILEMSAFKLGASPACEMDDHKMYYSKRDLWPLLVRAGFKPSRIRLQYRKLCMILIATAIKQ